MEGPPYFVRGVCTAGGEAKLLLSNDEEVLLDPRTLREGPDGALYSDAYPALAARFDKHAAVQLGELLEEDEQGPFFSVRGERVRPPRVDDPVNYLVQVKNA